MSKNVIIKEKAGESLNYIKFVMTHIVIVIVILNLSIKISMLFDLNFTLSFLVFYIIFITLIKVEVIKYYQNRFGIRFHLRF